MERSRHGIPVGIKDFYDTAGIPTKDAAGVEKLKKAGAIVVGKMNMHTPGMGKTGLESCFRPAKNPWNSHA